MQVRQSCRIVSYDVMLLMSDDGLEDHSDFLTLAFFHFVESAVLPEASINF
jgi:hypothetical protein